jgi:hypothetical protein
MDTLRLRFNGLGLPTILDVLYSALATLPALESINLRQTTQG